MAVLERTTWEGRPVCLTWRPGYRPGPAETVTQVSGLCLTGGGQILLVSLIVLTTTWTATFSVDGGISAPVPGSTTTDGTPVTFAVVQARPVLTNPFD